MIYWISTTVLSLFLFASALSYLIHAPTIEGVRQLGFPDFFRVQLAILKLLAALVLLAPFFPLQVKEWAYAGVGLFLLTAIIAHHAHGDPIFFNVINVFLLLILATSNLSLIR